MITNSKEEKMGGGGREVVVGVAVAGAKVKAAEAERDISMLNS